MRFLLQSDNVSQIEKRAVRAASVLTDAENYFSTLSAIQSGWVNPIIPLDSAPVGTVEFVTAVMKARGINAPEHLSYPECLNEFMQRKVWEGAFGDDTGNIFVKPRYDIKRFTGALRNDLEGCEAIELDYPVWYSEPVKFISEWRYYIVGNKIAGAGRYDDGEDEMPEPDLQLVEAGAQAMAAAYNGISGYALDFGVLEDGRTALVEANDGWALGYYKGTCSYKDYAELLHARWFEIVQQPSGAVNDTR